jgi:hypothetical protein
MDSGYFKPHRRPHRKTGRKRGRPARGTRAEKREAEYRKDLMSRGQKLGKERCEQILQYFMGLIAKWQPFEADGSPREGGDWEMFKEAVDFALRAAAIVMPYQSPKLASVTVTHEVEEEDPLQKLALWELRDRMIRRGIPIDHLLLNPPRKSVVEIEHEPVVGENGGG